MFIAGWLLDRSQSYDTVEQRSVIQSQPPNKQIQRVRNKTKFKPMSKTQEETRFNVL